MNPFDPSGLIAPFVGAFLLLSVCDEHGTVLLLLLMGFSSLAISALVLLAQGFRFKFVPVTVNVGKSTEKPSVQEY
jgi:hypothetical protein